MKAAARKIPQQIWGACCSLLNHTAQQIFGMRILSKIKLDFRTGGAVIVQARMSTCY